MKDTIFEFTLISIGKLSTIKFSTHSQRITRDQKDGSVFWLKLKENIPIQDVTLMYALTFVPFLIVLNVTLTFREYFGFPANKFLSHLKSGRFEGTTPLSNHFTLLLS